MSRSVTDPDTHFRLLRDARNRLDGRVKCECCGQVARHVEEIGHCPDCRQRDVTF